MCRFRARRTARRLTSSHYPRAAPFRSAGPRDSRAVGGQPGPQSRAIGGDQATPDTVLADVPLPQRQHQALAAHQAASADSDRSGRLLARPAWLSTEREPLIGIQTAISTPGVPGDPSRQRPIGQPARRQRSYQIRRDHRRRRAAGRIIRCNRRRGYVRRRHVSLHSYCPFFSFRSSWVTGSEGKGASFC
jgi:hypothetical protein